jgi:uncharacterized membrane protein YtjA (UPF0391 family)
MRLKQEIRTLLIFLIITLIAFVLGPLTIPSMNEEGVNGLNIWQAIFWWVCTIVFVVFMIRTLLQTFKVYKTRTHKPTRKSADRFAPASAPAGKR